MPDLNSLPKHWLAVAFDGRAHRHIVQEFNRKSQSRRPPASRSQDPRADALEATVAMPNLSALWQLPRTSVSLARLRQRPQAPSGDSPNCARICTRVTKTEPCAVAQVIRSKIRSNERSPIVTVSFHSQMLYPVELRAPRAA